MKKRTNFVSIAVSASLLLSGCGTGTPALSVSESETTTSAVETTTEDVTTASSSVTTVTSAEELDNGNDTAENKEFLDIPYGDFIGKRIECENRDTVCFNYGSLDGGFEEGIAPKQDSWDYAPVFQFPIGDSHWTPYVRVSSGALSKEYSDDFINKVNSNGYAAQFSYYIKDHWASWPTKFYLKSVDENAVYMDKIEYGFKSNIYDEFLVVNAFIRQTEDPADQNNEKRFEFIVDPASMSTLGLPMMGYDPETMKFEVNGCEFYADTMCGTGKSLSFISNDTLTEGLKNDDYIYAQVALMNTSFMFNNIDGAFISANVADIKLLTDDTDSVIDGSFHISSDANTDLDAAIEATKETLFTDKTISYALLDLDFDGTPEIIVQDYDNIDELSTPYATAHTTVYGYRNGSLNTIGNFDMNVEYTTLDEVIYIPTNERGWHFLNAKSHCFLTVKNGKLNILPITSRRSHDKDENGWDIYDYYYYDEKIVVEPYETFNPIKGTTETYYKWTGGNSLGWSVMGSQPYGIYDMLYEKVGDMYFKTLSK